MIVSSRNEKKRNVNRVRTAEGNPIDEMWIDRVSRTGISGLEVATSQRKEEVVPEVIINARNCSHDSLKTKTGPFRAAFGLITYHERL